jgi:hypothetical protein
MASMCAIFAGAFDAAALGGACLRFHHYNQGECKLTTPCDQVGRYLGAMPMRSSLDVCRQGSILGTAIFSVLPAPAESASMARATRAIRGARFGSSIATRDASSNVLQNWRTSMPRR